MKPEYYRTASKLAYCLSALPLFWVEAENLCLSFDGVSAVDLTHINGTGGDDGVAFLLLAVWIGFSALVLPLIKNRLAYGMFMAVYFVAQSMILRWIESTSAWGLVWDSVYHCHNGYLLLWLLLNGVFGIAGSLFLVRKSDVRGIEQ